MIEQVSHSELREVIADAYKVKVPVFIHGTFGIGKTDSVHASAQLITNNINMEISDKKKHLEYSNKFKDSNKDNFFVTRTIPAHHLDAGDLKGLAFPNAEKTKTTFLPTDYLPEIGQGILFFDELNLAPPMIQANLYQIILDRRLGNYEVPEGYMCIAAGNMEEDRSHAFSMALPLKNRFIHVQLTVPDVDDWVNNYALKNDVDHRIMSFLKGNVGLLHNYKPDKADEDITAIATPRTWAYLSKLIKMIAPDDKEKADGISYSRINRLANATVGVDVGNQFVAWMKMSLNYNIAEIYEKETIAKKPTQIDQMYSLSSALLSYYLKVPATDVQRKTQTAIKYAKIGMENFPKEHATLMLSQAKALDKDWLGFLKKDEKLYKGIVKDVTKFLI